jgi:predicted ATPase
MAELLTRFRIEDLHGRRTINVPIEDNRLILVGENGTGKSTVANLLYYLLTQQWRRFKDYKFAAIEVTVSGTNIRLSHEEVDTLAARQTERIFRLRHHYPTRTIRELSSKISRRLLLATEPVDDKLIQQWSQNLGVSTAMTQRLASELLAAQEKLPKHLINAVKMLQSLKMGQFLYLPTYRRIEQDLQSIFRGIEIEEKIKEFRDRFKKQERTTFIELVEFGMEDVEATIQLKMAQIKESVRTGLSDLTGTYLREVIRGLQSPDDIEVLRSMEPGAFESIFARIDEAILPSNDKKLLQNKISQIAQGDSFGSDDKVIAHFLAKLVSFFRKQEANETDVREFAELCNRYLTGKRFVYDNVNYSVFIRELAANPEERSASDQLELKMLSSGEKQIVSLFSHIYLSGEDSYFVIIDEPELSLSVPWQQRFLPDIISTGKCTGLIAVTHSPFIWENDLEPYVRTLAEFVEPINVLR